MERVTAGALVSAVAAPRGGSRIQHLCPVEPEYDAHHGRRAEFRALPLRVSNLLVLWQDFVHFVLNSEIAVVNESLPRVSSSPRTVP